MIELDKNEIEWIKLLKLHLKDKYDYKGSWVEIIKPMFIEHYGWNPDQYNNYQDYLECIFFRLFNLYSKIKEEHDKNGLNDILNASFKKRLWADSDLPIERAINTVCSLIQWNKVTNDDKTLRYQLL